MPVRRALPVQSCFGIAPQMLNAGTNVATVYLASLTLVPEGFGTFVLAFGAVSLALAAGRGLICSAVLAHLPAAPASDREPLVRSALGFTVLVGLLAGAILLGLSPWLPAVAWFAPWIPVALLHDVGRHIFLADGRRGWTLLLDVVWAVVHASVLVVWSSAGGGLPVGVLATAWGAGATAGLAVFALAAGARPADPRPWVRSTRDIAGWFTALSVLGQVELYLVLVLTAALLSPADAGGLRAVQLLVYQPQLVLCGAITALVVPAMAALRPGSPDMLHRWRRTTLSIVPVAAGALGTAAAGGPLMTLLFVDFTGYRALVLPVALQAAALALTVPTWALLLATRSGRLSFGLHVVRTALIAGGVAVGAGVTGPEGLAWSLAATGVAVLVLTTAVARRKLLPDLGVGRAHGPGEQARLLATG